MSQTTAKVKVASNVEGGYNGAKVVSFFADYADGKNKEWAEATPSLHLQMTVKADVAERFVPGKAFTLTFEEDKD